MRSKPHRTIQVSLPFMLTHELAQQALRQMKARLIESRAKKKRAIIIAERKRSPKYAGEEFLILVEELDNQCLIRVFSKPLEEQDAWGGDSEQIDIFEKYMKLLVFDTVRQHRDSFKSQGQEIAELKDREPHEILGISPDASQREILEAYRSKVKMYHPDQMAGLAPEFHELAEERMKAINAAFRSLMGRETRI